MAEIHVVRWGFREIVLMSTLNTFKTCIPLHAGPENANDISSPGSASASASSPGHAARLFSLRALEAGGFPGVSRLPYSLRILLENLLRHEDGRFVTAADTEALATWNVTSGAHREISFAPARVLLQDFTGVPAVVDLAAMRDGVARLGGSPQKVNPLVPVDLVIDHSVMVDVYARPDALQKNVDIEFERNAERYRFLRWGQDAFANFRVVPPGTGICHQVNLEYLG